jgi:hypothetical protein
VATADYQGLVERIAGVLRGAVDANGTYNPARRLLFSHVWSRPTLCGKPGFCTDENIGQDSGDVFALMIEGYNFDGTQSPVVTRLGDVPTGNPFSVPNFYGAHGHDSERRSMSAIFYAAGPDVKQGREIERMRNIDVAPTILELLGVAPAPSVDGTPLKKILK